MIDGLVWDILAVHLGCTIYSTGEIVAYSRVASLRRSMSTEIHHISVNASFLAISILSVSTLSTIHLHLIHIQDGWLTAYSAQVGIDKRWSRPEIIFEKGEKGIQERWRARDGSSKDTAEAGGYQARIEQV
jgi:hypothetical protein